MRTKQVTINGKTVTVKEKRVKELREQVLPMLLPAVDELVGVDSVEQLFDKIPAFEEKIASLFDDVTVEDIENAYMSEIEELLQAFVDVNFFGLKRLLGQVFSLTNQVGLKSLSASGQ